MISISTRDARRKLDTQQWSHYSINNFMVIVASQKYLSIMVYLRDAKKPSKQLHKSVILSIMRCIQSNFIHYTVIIIFLEHYLF